MSGTAAPARPRLRRCGRTAFLVELDDLASVHRTQRGLVAARVDGVVDLVPALRTLLVEFDPRVVDARRIEDAVLEAALHLDDGFETTEHLLDVVYDGQDLAHVADLLGTDEAGVVAWHTQRPWTVAFNGFAPGFPYLVREGDDAPSIPRLTSPRLEVPPGAVALAGEFTGIYPRSSPGGWQILGRTDAVLFDLARETPALLGPGDVVRFRPIEAP